MHKIYGGKNVDKLLENKQNKYSLVYINSAADIFTTTSLSMYESAYESHKQEVIDISDDMLNKALTVLEITNDFKLTLKSLIKE